MTASKSRVNPGFAGAVASARRLCHNAALQADRPVRAAVAALTLNSEHPLKDKRL
jgi:hypothetical protein